MLRNLSIGRKLALLIAPPLVALVLLAVVAVRPKLAESEAAHLSRHDALIADTNMQFRDEIQVERDLTIRWLATKSAQVRLELEESRTLASKKADDFLKEATEDDSNLVGTSELDTAIATTKGYAELRKTVDAGNLSPALAFDEFSRRLNVHAELNRALVKSGEDAALVRIANSIDNYLRYKDAVAQNNSFIGLRLEGGSFSASDYAVANGNLVASVEHIGAFRASASPELRSMYDDAVRQSAVATADNLYNRIAADAATGKPLTVPADQWWSATSAKLDAIDVVEDAVFEEFVNRARALESDASSASYRYIGLTALATILAAAAAIALARSISRRLAKISSEANSIATDRLPEVLNALRNPSAEALAQALPQVKSDAKDEIGVMADSFNTVLRTSVETSIAHSQRRARTLTNILVNLGRRNQALIDRQLLLIDELESSQRDPELLQGLFALDHMITTMRRNAENLLVLASEQAARPWTEPVPLLDVIRGAVAEVQDMSRIHIEVNPNENGMVAGRFAVDLSHLLAELVDNSISFSAPQTTVQINAERSGPNYRVWIMDRGLGMTEADYEDANERIAHLPDLDELSTDRVGFQVVGRLAQRLNVQVRLQANPGGGTATSVTIPLSLFEQGQPKAAEAPAAPATSVPAPAPAAVATAATAPPEATRERVLPEVPAESPVTADDAAKPAAKSAGLQKRVPGQNFVGDVKAAAFDSGVFRRFPAAGDGAAPSAAETDLARRRLEAISRMQASLDRARSEEIDPLNPPASA